MASSLEQFRQKKEAALRNGWNDSGPVTESPAMKSIIGELEKRVTRRLSSPDGTLIERERAPLKALQDKPVPAISSDVKKGRSPFV